jgi:hypothetical protein
MSRVFHLDGRIELLRQLPICGRLLTLIGETASVQSLLLRNYLNHLAKGAVQGCTIKL